MKREFILRKVRQADLKFHCIYQVQVSPSPLTLPLLERPTLRLVREQVFAPAGPSSPSLLPHIDALASA